MTDEVAMSLWVIPPDICDINGVIKHVPRLPPQGMELNAPAFAPGRLKAFRSPTWVVVH